jgi:hypothetical protein
MFRSRCGVVVWREALISWAVSELHKTPDEMIMSSVRVAVPHLEDDHVLGSLRAASQLIYCGESEASIQTQLQLLEDEQEAAAAALESADTDDDPVTR